MILKNEYRPQFREADANGRVGLRGYINYFQDTATHYMYELGKTNEVLPEKYGIFWMYTKYKMHVERQADFSKPLQFETWVEKSKSTVRVYQDLVITRDDKLYAQGRLECCLYNMNTNRLCRMEDIEYPMDTIIDKSVDIEGFTRIKTNIDDMEYIYSHVVRYTDLDNSMHMNNLKYIDLLLNAFDSKFYNENSIVDFEIHYLSQCFEGEEIKVYRKDNGEEIILAGAKEDGTIAVQGIIGII